MESQLPEDELAEGLEEGSVDPRAPSDDQPTDEKRTPSFEPSSPQPLVSNLSGTAPPGDGSKEEETVPGSPTSFFGSLFTSAPSPAPVVANDTPESPNSFLGSFFSSGPAIGETVAVDQQVAAEVSEADNNQSFFGSLFGASPAKNDEPVSNSAEKEEENKPGFGAFMASLISPEQQSNDESQTGSQGAPTKPDIEAEMRVKELEDPNFIRERSSITKDLVQLRLIDGADAIRRLKAVQKETNQLLKLKEIENQVSVSKVMPSPPVSPPGQLPKQPVKDSPSDAVKIDVARGAGLKVLPEIKPMRKASSHKETIIQDRQNRKRLPVSQRGSSYKAHHSFTPLTTSTRIERFPVASPNSILHPSRYMPTSSYVPALNANPTVVVASVNASYIPRYTFN
jgi:hypothetical protein